MEGLVTVLIRWRGEALGECTNLRRFTAGDSDWNSMLLVV
jgi:hypothetical protein